MPCALEEPVSLLEAIRKEKDEGDEANGEKNTTWNPRYARKYLKSTVTCAEGGETVPKPKPKVPKINPNPSNCSNGVKNLFCAAESAEHLKNQRKRERTRDEYLKRQPDELVDWFWSGRPPGQRSTRFDFSLFVCFLVLWSFLYPF